MYTKEQDLADEMAYQRLQRIHGLLFWAITLAPTLCAIGLNVVVYYS